jgi:membrane protein implicated in regulation of membrane protease activity
VRVSLRYVLFQIPGWTIVAIILAGLWHWEILPPWAAALVFVAWVVKDILLYPVFRTAYDAEEKSGLQVLVGARGVAEGDLKPDGFVRVRGELWRAVANPNNKTISSGTRVEIVSAEGMKLRVRPLDPD